MKKILITEKQLENLKINSNILTEEVKRFRSIDKYITEQETVVNGFNDFPPFGHADKQDNPNPEQEDNFEEDKPDWLETLWNINPGLAKRAEDDLKNNYKRINNKEHYQDNQEDPNDFNLEQ